MLGWLVNCELANLLKAECLSLIMGGVSASRDLILDTIIITVSDLV